jgi:hypothetical protein
MSLTASLCTWSFNIYEQSHMCISINAPSLIVFLTLLYALVQKKGMHYQARPVLNPSTIRFEHCFILCSSRVLCTACC